jgi:hypothetical protein
MIGVDLQPGQELICINALPCGMFCPLTEGRIYTLRGYSMSPMGYISVLVNETKAPQDGVNAYYWRYPAERGFFRWRFRLLILHHSLTDMLEFEPTLELMT